LRVLEFRGWGLPRTPDRDLQAGSYLRLIDFVYHSTLGLRVIKKAKIAIWNTNRKRGPDSGPVFGNCKAKVIDVDLR